MVCGQKVLPLCPTSCPPERIHPVGGTSSQELGITRPVSLLRCPRACTESVNKVATVAGNSLCVHPQHRLPPHSGLCCMCSCQTPRWSWALIGNITHDNLPPHAAPSVLQGATSTWKTAVLLTRTAVWQMAAASLSAVLSTARSVIAIGSWGPSLRTKGPISDEQGQQ